MAETKLMEGGNVATNGSGITHSPPGEQNVGTTINQWDYILMQGGNGANAVSVVTLCSNRAYPIDVAENLLWM